MGVGGVGSEFDVTASTVAADPPAAAAGRMSRPTVLVVFAVFVCADVASTVVLAARSDHLPNPVVRGALAEWIILGYLSAGLSRGGGGPRVGWDR